MPDVTLSDPAGAWGIVIALLLMVVSALLSAGLIILRSSRTSTESSLQDIKSSFKTALKELSDTSQKNDREHDRRISRLQKEFNDFRSRMPEVYVLREDWIRNSVTLDKKMDDMGEQLRCIDRKLSKFIGEREANRGSSS